ncbi:HEAT repeat domain-containing protein [Ewingella sp. AOP9-I1-14]
MMPWLKKILGKKSIEPSVTELVWPMVEEVKPLPQVSFTSQRTDLDVLDLNLRTLLREIDKLMAEPKNWEFWFPEQRDMDPITRLGRLTYHYNGHIRQHAVTCLGMMQGAVALPYLIHRANDWAWQVRDAARQSIRHFMQPIYAADLVNCLPDLYKLLNGERDDHQKLINEIIEFLCQLENRQMLILGLTLPTNKVARLCLQVVLDRQLLAEDEVYLRVEDHNDVLLRRSAVEALLQSPHKLSVEIVNKMLCDNYAAIKQLALNVVMEKNLVVHPQLLLQLLFDRNEIVRRRSANLVDAQGMSATQLYLAAFNDESKSVTQRGIALLGLSEQKYVHTLELALNHLESQQPKMVKIALRVVVRYQQEEAKQHLLNALIHPVYPIAKYANQQIVKLKLYVSLNMLQHCFDAAPSPKHTQLCVSLTYRLNIWDAIIFSLSNLKTNKAEFAQETLLRSERRINRFSAQPKEAQKDEIQGLLKLHPEITSKDNDYFQRLLSQ